MITTYGLSKLQDRSIYHQHRQRRVGAGKSASERWGGERKRDRERRPVGVGRTASKQGSAALKGIVGDRRVRL